MSFDRIGSPGEFARKAIQTACSRQQAAARRLGEVGGATPGGQAGGAGASAGTNPITSFGAALKGGVDQVAQSTAGVDQLPLAVIDGRVNDFHEAATALKQAEVSLKFALQVRNKFVDAYREVMRMSV